MSKKGKFKPRSKELKKKMFKMSLENLTKDILENYEDVRKSDIVAAHLIVLIRPQKENEEGMVAFEVNPVSGSSIFLGCALHKNYDYTTKRLRGELDRIIDSASIGYAGIKDKLEK